MRHRTAIMPLVRYAPVILFSVMYALTCLIGALLLLLDFRPYAALYEHFSGFHAPRNRPDLIPTQLVLLIVPPVLMWVAYVVGSRIRVPDVGGQLGVLRWRESRTSPLLPHIVFYVVAGVGALSLSQSGSIPSLLTWLDPQAALDARYEAFRNLSFFEFVNLYTVVPIAAAWVVLARRASGIGGHILRWLPVIITVGLLLLLFQKRPALNAVILISAAFVLFLQRVNARRAQLMVAVGISALVAVYLVLVMAPAYFETNQELSATTTASRDYPVTPTIGAIPPAATAPTAVAEGGKTPTILLYALIGPLNRTSAFALYYPVIYPEIHPYYGLDVGQDMLGKLPWFDVGPMPDDNIVVWDFLAPTVPGGRVAAPFQFVLFSQVGVLGALIGSVVLGLVLALAWRGAQDPRLPAYWAALAGGLVLLFSIFVAMDSIRNSLLVSYGVFWGFLFLGVIIVLDAAVRSWRARDVTRGIHVPIHGGAPASGAERDS
jgi:hypothetical protein